MVSTSDNEFNYDDYKRWIDDVTKLSSNIICRDCCGEVVLHTGVCPYCGKQFFDGKDISKRLNELISQIGDKSLKLNTFTICLYTIREQFPKVNELLKKNKIEEQLYERLDDINLKLANSEKLNNSDELFLSLCLIKNIKPKNGLNDINIFRNIYLNDNKIVSYEVFKNVIISFIKDIMLNINANRIKQYNPFCFVNDFSKTSYENVGGYIEVDNYSIVKINERIIKNIYNGSVTDFKTIFHELMHIQQEIEIKLGYFNEDIQNFIKDQILRKLSAKEGFDYYSENYQFISFEKDANIKGFMCTINFFEQTLGLKLRNDILVDLEKNINIQLEEKSNLIRKIGTKEHDINSIFDYYIKKHPELLEEYPQLTIEYIVDKSLFSRKKIVRRKNIEELQKTLEIYNEQPAIVSYIENLLTSQPTLNNRRK